MSAPSSCSIEPRPSARVLEFIAFQWPPGAFDAAAWPCAPGAVLRDAAQQPRLLHFSPGRWLLPAPTPKLAAQLDAATRAGLGVTIDASGKWERLDIVGPGAARLLACAIEIHGVLEGRDCAAVRLFDCPAVVARVQHGYAVWVQASYVGDFLATAGRFRATLGGHQEPART